MANMEQFYDDLIIINLYVFCFATYGQLLQIALSDGNFSSILKLVSYNITTSALAGSVKRQA